MIFLPIFSTKNIIMKLQIPLFSPSNIWLEGVAVSYESDNFAISLITAQLHAVHNAKSTAREELAQTPVIYVV